ncbi:type II toxin-antitoxin system ParD family antitoxin [Qipengyuania sp. ASV99]|uniref:type II toxin-antitoxin system ParD family antitoxin n=1 Tax=Qipengyuania sp. ASV99 TaxID=3399681 RepID=UPI003A4C6004
MGKNTSVSLTERHQKYLQAKIESGEFASASEVIRDALRRAEERDRRIANLRELIREGEESGDPAPFDLDQFLQEMHAKHKGAA